MSGKKGMKININHEDSKRFAEYWKKENHDWTIEQCEEKAKWFKRSCNYQCIEYYERNYPELTHEEHLKLKNELQKQKQQNKDTNIEYWKKRYPEKSLEELEVLRSEAAKKKNKCNIEYWVNKYPEKTEEEINILYKEFYQSWLSHQMGWGKGDKNCNSKNNTTQEERNSRSPRNVEFYKRKYPELSHEEHLNMLNDFFAKNKIIIKNTIKPTNIEYYLNQGMSMEEAKKALHDRQATFTLEKCIKKYGEIEGLKIFSERQQKWLKSLSKNFIKNGDGRSIQSFFAKTIIEKCCLSLNIDIPKHEKYIYDIIYKRAYSFDFTYNHKIIEFNGDYWHCNPSLYSKDYINKRKGKTAEEIWEYDKAKKDCAEKYGYKVLTIWESDYLNNEDETIQKCISFLTND